MAARDTAFSALDRCDADAMARLAREARALLPLDGVPLSPQPLSLFAAMRWRGGACPDVHLGGSWGRLHAVNGMPAAAIVQAAARLAGRDWQRAMIVEFPRLLANLGAGTPVCAVDRPGHATAYVVASADRLVSAVWHYLSGADHPAPAAVAATALTGLSADRDTVTRAEVLVDLQVAETLVRREFAYWAIASRAWDRCLEELRATAADTDRRAHVARLHALFATLGDAHTRVDRSDPDMLGSGLLPLQLDWTGAALLALDPTTSAPIDRDHPVVARLGGRPVADWVRAVAACVPRGTAAGRRNWTAREIRRAGAHAAGAGAVLTGTPNIPGIDMDLTSVDGTSRRRLSLPLVARETPSTRPTVEGRRLRDDLGLLALRRRMDGGPQVVADLHATMRHLAGAAGLVIDIRDNPGGSRDLLRALIGYFLRPDEALVIAWARLRREVGADPDDAADVLAGRYLRPWNWSGWSAAAARAARDFHAGYAPEWPRPDDPGFGPLTLFIGERVAEQGDLFFPGPVALLINHRNYSASDVFASAFARLPAARLFGTATSGGSGFARASVLPGSRLGIQISAMASGTADGNLYENHGIAPDVVIPDDPGRWRGGTADDPVLAAALAHLTAIIDSNRSAKDPG